MRGACLRLRDKAIRCSCRTAFAVERNTMARVVPSRASSMGPTSSIPHGKVYSVKTVHFGWNFPLQGLKA